MQRCAPVDNLGRVWLASHSHANQRSETLINISLPLLVCSVFLTRVQILSPAISVRCHSSLPHAVIMCIFQKGAHSPYSIQHPDIPSAVPPTSRERATTPSIQNASHERVLASTPSASLSTKITGCPLKGPRSETGSRCTVPRT